MMTDILSCLITMDFYDNKINVKSLLLNDAEFSVSILGDDNLLYSEKLNISYGVKIWFKPNRNFSEFNFISVNVEVNRTTTNESFRIKNKHGNIIKPIAIKTFHVVGMGDYFTATPLIRKLYNIYNRKIDVFCFGAHYEVLQNNRYVNSINNSNDFNDDMYDKYEVITIFDNWESAYYYSDMRQLVAQKAGMTLKEEELEYDYIPSPYEEIHNLPQKYVCINPRIAGPDRSWEKSKWQFVVDELNNMGIYVVSIGKGKVDEDYYNLNIKLGVDLSGQDCQNNLSQTWHILNRSDIFIGFDTGVYILAGTTNTHIILMGWYGDPFFHQPIRNGSRDYKFSHVRGNCDVFCLTDPKFDVDDKGSIMSRHSVWNCMLDRNFVCKPKPEKILLEILRVLKK